MPSSTASRSSPPPPYSSNLSVPTQPFPAFLSDSKPTGNSQSIHSHSRSHSTPFPTVQRSRTRPRHNSTYLPPDVIDFLDDISPFHYHHEGPYDAASPYRNRSRQNSNPIDALKITNEEALKATPPGKLVDSIRHSRPLDGVAYYPPGFTDPEGNTYDYEEGWNMVTEEDRGILSRRPGMHFANCGCTEIP
ncbi:hypothetical protein AJ78_08810 [Emergomyces pasteurianus Ep9510]|uniref:Uncharacterized protein n=1 Tax=Emergomyces pasteurianus Ep9510 TaxID=1447872 RepID=A0A1J9P1C4_9EURO|nr:hypothetical protein AJ78_08810 [Emergomyces pasteurianus Ep9510]